MRSKLFHAVVLAGLGLGATACGPLPEVVDGGDAGRCRVDAATPDGGASDGSQEAGATDGGRQPQCGWPTTK